MSANMPLSKVIPKVHYQRGGKADQPRVGYVAKCVNIFLLLFTILGHIIQSTTAFMEGNVGFKAILRSFVKDFVALI